MSKAPGTTFSFIQDFHFLPFGLFMTGNDHLCNSLSIFYRKFLRRKVNQDNTNLSPIIGIDSTGRI